MKPNIKISNLIKEFNDTNVKHNSYKSNKYDKSSHHSTLNKKVLLNS